MPIHKLRVVRVEARALLLVLEIARVRDDFPPGGRPVPLASDNYSGCRGAALGEGTWRTTLM
jgi:hypothetical protein